MNQKIFITLLIVLMPLLDLAWGHGTNESPVAPADLSDESIIHRIKQLGYSEIKIVRTNKDSADVELQRADQRYSLTVSRHLLGPGSLAVYNVAEIVEGLLRPVDGLNDPVVPAIEKPIGTIDSERIH